MSVSSISGTSSLFSSTATSSTSATQDEEDSYIDVPLEKIEEQQEALAAQKKPMKKKNKRLGIVNQTIMTLFLYPKKRKLI